MITIEDAILALVPNAEFVVYENKIIQWDSEGTQPTEDEIATKKTELQTEFESNEYQRDRALAYPSLSEFVEAYTEKEIGEDSTKRDAYVTKYNQVRTYNPTG